MNREFSRSLHVFGTFYRKKEIAFKTVVDKCYKTENMYPTRRPLANDSTLVFVINRFVWGSIDFSVFSKPYPNTRYYSAVPS